MTKSSNTPKSEENQAPKMPEVAESWREHFFECPYCGETNQCAEEFDELEECVNCEGMVSVIK